MNHVSQALRALSRLIVNPALGGGGIRSTEAAALADHLATLVEGGKKTAGELESVAEGLHQLAHGDGHVTSKHLDVLKQRLEALLAPPEKKSKKDKDEKPPEDNQVPEGESKPPEDGGNT